MSDTAVGWRFWTVRPGDVLRAPYGRGIPWPARRFDAVCNYHPNHRPPADGCFCGVAADPGVAELCARARAYRAYFGAAAAVFGNPFHLVIGRVVLWDAVSFVTPAFLPRFGAYELRAAAAEIVELFVSGDDRDAEVVQSLADALAAYYAVPVTIGEAAAAA